MLLVFLVLCTSGVISFFSEYTRKIATVHTLFGIIFIIIALVHILNNVRAIKKYSSSWIFLISMVLMGTIGLAVIAEASVVSDFMDFGARQKAINGSLLSTNKKSEILMSLTDEVQLSLELKAAQHFWHPQIAVWTEDTLGNYIETLFITKATAKGIFAGGRTKDNYKTLDTSTQDSDKGFRRVNALPVWSHKRGVIYEDGMPMPTIDSPMPDGITGATPLGNFILKSSVDYQDDFILKMEINVAFDDNEYYSEYDFAEDEIFHNGTGQLGQPSLIYDSYVDIEVEKGYIIMKLKGHGHHSGRDGIIYPDFSKLTSALDIVEYVIVGYKKRT